MSGFVRWLKFSFVGLIGVGVQLGALFLLTRVTRTNYLPAIVLAVECAVLHNFLWHQRFTWKDRRHIGVWQALTSFVRFNTGNGAISLVGNVVLMRLLVGQLHFRVIPANLVSVAACALANFIVSDRWVFTTSRVETSTMTFQPRRGDIGKPGTAVPGMHGTLTESCKDDTFMLRVLRIRIVAPVSHEQQRPLRERHINQRGAGGERQPDSDLGNQEKRRECPQLIERKNEQENLSEFRDQAPHFECHRGEQVQANGYAD